MSKDDLLNPLKPDGTVEHSLGWTPTADEHRRAYVMELYANPDIDPIIELQQIDMRVEYVKTGKIPTIVKTTALRPVK